MRKWFLIPALIVPVAVGAAWPLGADTVRAIPRPKVELMDLASFSAERPDQPIDLVFLHHSVGGHLLSERGPDDGKWRVHPNGGNLRQLLTQNNYRVHDATYGSKLGERTDLFDWLPKFRDEMPGILRVSEQDSQLPEVQVNRVVLFKSCYPNNEFVSEGQPPGNPKGPELTLANAQASFRELLPIFQREPKTLFVFLTTPPVVGQLRRERAYKIAAKRLLGRPTAVEALEKQGELARSFNDWAASPKGWLKDYPLSNVAVFHFYDLLTGPVGSNFLAYPTGDGTDSHPSAEGNGKAAQVFVPFLNRVVRRAGLVPALSADATGGPAQ